MWIKAGHHEGEGGAEKKNPPQKPNCKDVLSGKCSDDYFDAIAAVTRVMNAVLGFNKSGKNKCD